ncbi:hypothetical protein KIN20_028710 [Parelaphostrongylus tenuis]|uniref:Uncharacterized protein n=1 Tax=Parelaphostrongylus tenuis TaxID=148309 RepID=A0AAD5R166_PARTN|nr:hypothetical protein KIN20_028710 [Parelaphostrongylus tenuis]
MGMNGNVIADNHSYIRISIVSCDRQTSLLILDPKLYQWGVTCPHRMWHINE